MRRLYPFLKWLTATIFVVIGGGLLVSYIYDWFTKAESAAAHRQLIIDHWPWLAIPMTALLLLTAWAYFDDRRHKAPDGSKPEATNIEVKPQIEVSPRISPTISPTIAPNFTFSPTIQVPAPPVTADSKSRVPHQLRPPPLDFTGRADDVQELLRAVREQGIRILALRGMGGLGKTALALKIAETLTPDFPDGQIHLDLKGAPHKGDSPGVRPLTAAEAMDYVIRSYNPGVPALPNDDARETEYRNTLFGKRALLLMDNARDRDQIERLIPPDGCVMVVTSRNHFTLPGLMEKDLEKLPAHDAQDLMLKIAPRIRQLADDFAKLCDYLPEALRNTASAIAERRTLDPQDFLRRMSDNQERLKITGVELSLTTSSELLETELRGRWLLLGVFPDTFDYNAAGSVWECAPEATKDALSDLLRYSLIEWNSLTSRYRLHDLARDFATVRLEDSVRIAAQGRHATHYKDVLAAANQKYLKSGTQLEGLALFDLELGNIEAGQAWAAANSKRDRAAAQLCEAYPNVGATVLFLRQMPRDWIKWLEAASNSAKELGDRVYERATLGNLGLAYGALGDYRRAIEFHEQHLAITRQLGDRDGEGKALANLASAYYWLGEYRRAIKFSEQRLATARELRDRRGQGIAFGGLGNAYYSLADYRRAIEFHEQWLTIARERGDRQGEGNALSGLGNAYSSLGECHRAIELYEQSLAIAREIGGRRGEGDNLWNSALTLDKLGDRAQAIRRADQALRIYEQIESPAAERVRKQLAEWRGDTKV